MLARTFLSEAERQVDPQLGYPRGYAKLCRNAATQLRGLITPFTEGPPQRFIPYAPQPDEIARLKELDAWFPVVAEEDRDPPNARKYADFLWRQLDHLGNAGFDPAKFRVDMYGNVLYWNADAGSPLAWEIDHWFPHSRGGKTVMSNLRVLQWQTNQRKSNKLEFLVPWWDLQLGVSINQFLSVFSSKNADFRKRSLELFFAGGEEEQVEAKCLVEPHSWPAPFREQKAEIGLAAAAVVSVSRRDNDDKIRGTASWASRSGTDLITETSAVAATGTPARRRWSLEEEEALRRAVHKFGPGSWKEIKESEPALAGRSTVQIKDKYRLLRGDWHPDKENVTANVDKETAVAAAIQKERKLKQMREDEKKVKEEELAHLEDTLGAITRENEAEFLALEDLERVLVRSREKVEKQRRWSETQSSYRICLERMIRDTMHQSVVYKEQARLNQAACNALQVRLDCEKQTSVAAGTDLVKKYKQREELLALSCPDQLDSEVANELKMQAMTSFALAEDEEGPNAPKLTDSEHRWLPRLPPVAEDGCIPHCASKPAGKYDQERESSDTRSNTRSLQAGGEEELVASLRSLKLREDSSDLSRSPAEGSSGKRSLDEEKEKLGKAGREGSRLKKKKKVDDKDSSDFRFKKAAMHEVDNECGKERKLTNRPVCAVDKELGRDRTGKEGRQLSESGAPLGSWSTTRAKLHEGVAETGYGSSSGSGTTYLRAIDGDRLQKVDKVSRVTEWLDAVPTPRPIRGQERSEVWDSSDRRPQEDDSVEDDLEPETDGDGDGDDIEHKITMVGFEYGDAGRARLQQETEEETRGGRIEEEVGTERRLTSRRDARRLRRGDAILEQIDAWLDVETAREAPKSSEGESSEEQKNVIVVGSPTRHGKEEPLLDEILHDMLDAHLSNSADAEEVDEDEKLRQLGKSNLDKWLHVLLHKEAVAAEEPSNIEGDGNAEVCPGTPQAEDESLERLRMDFTNAVAKERSEQEINGEKPTGLLVALLKKLSFRPPVETKHWLRSSLSVKRTEEAKGVCEEQEGTFHGGAEVEEIPAATAVAGRTSDEDACGGVGGDFAAPSSSLRASIKACTVAWKRAVKKMETRPVSTTWALL